MQEQKVVRILPYKKPIIAYPLRKTEDDFKNLDKLLLNLDFLNIVSDLERGINFETKKKIKIGGYTHTKLCNKHNIYFYNQMKQINKEAYLKETQKLHEEIDKQNDSIREYNRQLDDKRSKISELQKWSDSLEIEGTIYGLPKVMDRGDKKYHMEDDCMGEVEVTDGSIDCLRMFCYDNCICRSKTRTYCKKCKFDETS